LRGSDVEGICPYAIGTGELDRNGRGLATRQAGACQCMAPTRLGARGKAT
jgi:hypothetical protein